MVEFGSRLRKNDMCDLISDSVVQLVNKLGDSQAKIRDEAAQLTLKLALSKQIGQSFIAGYIFKKGSKKALALKHLQGRLMVILDFINEFGLIPEMTVDNIMGFLEENSAFSHQSKEIRDLAKEISVKIFKTIGDDIQPYLKTLRPKQLEEYQAAFETAASNTNTSDHSPMKSELKKTNQAKSQHAKSSTTAKQVAPPPARSAILQDVDQNSEASVDEFTCPFCDTYNETFDSDHLDQHFWAECLMLTQCKMCTQVIEISGLNEHLLIECDHRTNHRECPKCGEAITVKYFDKHTSLNDCVPTPSPNEGSRCPLCHTDIAPFKNGWKDHLMNKQCTNNPRAIVS